MGAQARKDRNLCFRLDHLATVISNMHTYSAIIGISFVICSCAAVQLKVRDGKTPGMEDVLAVSKRAHVASESYASSKAMGEVSSKDILLANALTRASLDSDVAAELSQGDVGTCPGC